jgi:DME family drug/metabolite transporter
MGDGDAQRAPLLVVVAAMLWGTTGTAQALGPDGTTPLGVGTLRIAVGALALVAIARGRVTGPMARAVPAGLVLGAAGVAVYQVSFFAATSRSGVALGTVLAIGSGPVFAGLLDTVRTRHRPDAVWLAATALAVTGGALLVAGGQGDARADVLGITYALTAGLSYACYSLGAKNLVSAGWPSATAMAAMFGLGALVLLPLLAFEPLAWVGTLGGVVMLVHLGVVTVALAYLLYGRALHWLPVSTVVTLSLAEPVTAALLGVAVLDEHLPPVGWLGAALVLAGLVLVGRAVSRRPRADT